MTRQGHGRWCRGTDQTKLCAPSLEVATPAVYARVAPDAHSSPESPSRAPWRRGMSAKFSRRRCESRGGASRPISARRRPPGATPGAAAAKPLLAAHERMKVRHDLDHARLGVARRHDHPEVIAGGVA